ncbi:hypothetical protein SAMD00019534_023410 [Acytostelium subglobosum LB1]|uniref:hypothetical protein n=1 Tax=Acytostelium subglobosum LB1 TaxID=1410327 RepID=UPI000644BD07|nr:hypothetical protein SAMD00019534_023410 [Acytostelium subglobosum LB1]GAM19166.1 hypothetical protein SAMD00019534_023410 [Acytostelium subglobosum LB1]|eukprot:XP_012757093.1 hypothetical protein SAMD00019534_023410 [Acytostelium subglobosum LB1]
MKRCAKAGNIIMFQRLINIFVGFEECLGKADLSELVKVACDHRQMDSLQYLINNHYPQNISIRSPISKIFRPLLIKDSSSSEPTFLAIEELDVAKIPMSLLAGIRSDDLEIVRSFILSGDDEGPIGVDVFELDAKLCRRMSASMAALIVSPRIYRFKFGIQSLVSMVEVASKGKHASNITVDIVCSFILNCDFDPHTDVIKSALVLAAGFSVQVLELIHKRFNINITQKSDILRNAIQMQCCETMSYLFKHLDQKAISNIIFFNHVDIFQHGTLECVTLLMDQYADFKESLLAISSSLQNDNIEVLEYVINQTSLKAKDKQVEGYSLNDIIQSAPYNYRPKVIQLLEQRFGPVTKSSLEIPSTTTLNQWHRSGNAHHIIGCLFNNSFTKESRTDILRFLYTTLKQWTHYTHVVMLCTDHIKAITSLDSVGTLQHDVEVTPPTHLASSRLQTALHSVFKDHKLGVLIMSHVGHVHRSLSIPLDNVIKGSKLLDNHSLSDYLRYGATEWFLQSYSNSIFMSKTHHQFVVNSSLLGQAFLKYDSKVIDALLTNPQIDDEGGERQHIEFVTNLSSCTSRLGAIV